MKIKIQKLLSLSFFISKQILQCNTQAVNTNNSNPSPSNQQQSNNQNASGIPDEQLKTFSYGAEEFTMAIIGDRYGYFILYFYCFLFYFIFIFLFFFILLLLLLLLLF